MNDFAKDTDVLISREATIRAFAKRFRVGDENTIIALTFGGCKKVIESMPSEERYGWWMKYPGEVVSDDGLWGETLYDCSNCGHTVHVATRFCAHCGTRMYEHGEIKVRWKPDDH